VTSSLSPWIQVVCRDGQTIVQTSEYEVFDFLDDYFLESIGLDYTYVLTRPTESTPGSHQLIFSADVPLKVVEDALSALDPLEIRRMAEINGRD
jgi:hypothetical protein